MFAAIVAAGCRPSNETEPVAPPPGTDQPEASGPPVAAPIPEGTVKVGGASLVVQYEGRELPVDRAETEAWIERSATMVRDYLGEFPVPRLEITLVGRGLGGVGFGLHQDGRFITVYCGRQLSPAKLNRDWVLVHEMLHAAFPDLRREHNWMQEGLSTYLEPIVRARAGNIDEEQVWRRLTRSLHYGRPRAGDKGLDKTHTWGRKYWGGALFWLVVDVELRERTNNEKSLRDIVQGILAEGGNGRANWSTGKVVEVGDAATGTTVLSETYAAMARAPGDIDLDRLYHELGIHRSEGQVFFDDDAPLAYVRRAITRK